MKPTEGRVEIKIDMPVTLSISGPETRSGLDVKRTWEGTLKFGTYMFTLKTKKGSDSFSFPVDVEKGSISECRVELRRTHGASCLDPRRLSTGAR